MQFRILGPVEVVHEDEVLPLGGPKQRTVLALLISSAGNPVSSDALIDGVYGDDAPEGARRSIHTYISNLRGSVGDLIRHSHSSYVLDTDRRSIDWQRFEDDVAAAGKELEPHRTARALRDALAQWRGHPYTDIDGCSRLEPEITRLEELRMQALEDRFEAELAAGNHHEVLGELASLASEYPLRERLRAQHMIALYRCDRQAEALRCYDTTRRFLLEELGIDPSPKLQRLVQQILAQDPALQADPRPRIVRATVLVADLDPAGLSTLDPDRRDVTVTAHSKLIEEAISRHGGAVFAVRGTAAYSSFSHTDQAAAAGETMLAAAERVGPQLLRVAIDSGDVEDDGDGHLSGPPVRRGANLVAAAHPGQAILSSAAHRSLSEQGAAGWTVRALGRHDIDGIEHPEEVYQLVVANVPASFPPLRNGVAPPPLPVSRRGVPGCEMREEVGRGMFGVVHRGYQPLIGREVAIKAIHPQWSNRVDFIRRFEVEAQMVARLEHPHINPLYDYWRDPDGAYLVTRWQRGGSLAQRLAQGPLPLVETTRLVTQIAPALAAAHRAGVVHGNLKATNVLLDEGGDAYLADFAIATDDSGDQGKGRRRDLRALGLLIHQALSGRPRPEAEADEPGTGIVLPELASPEAGISDDVDRVLRRAIAPDPADRYFDALEFLDHWHDAVEPGAALLRRREQLSPTRNPFKGLDAFQESDALDFFGRTGAVEALVDALTRRPFVALVGPSGVGKSSVIHAGLIPALRRGAVPGSDNWITVATTPGPRPFEQLASALLRIAAHAAPGLEHELAAHPDRGVASVRDLRPEGAAVLVVIDQLEELFTLTSDPAVRTAYLGLLSRLVTDPDSPVRLVVGIRADFFDHPLEHAAFGDLLHAGTVPLAVPTTAELGEIIEHPARVVGVAFEPGLCDHICNEVQVQPGGLPLLEYTLTDLFEHRTADLITFDDYRESGGILGALGRRAESLYQSFDARLQETVRRLFLRLVAVAETAPDLRRSVRRSELERIGLERDALGEVIDRFSAARLITLDRDPVTRGPTLQVAHEALFREWGRLASWIDTHREDLLQHRRLSLAMTEWEESGRESGFLLTGDRRQMLQTWADRTTLPISTPEAGFLAESRTHDARQQSRRTRRRRAIAAGLALAAVVSMLLAVFAIRQAGLRHAEARVNRARELAADSVAALDTDPELSLILASAAIEVTDPPERAAVEALHRALEASRLRYRILWTGELPPAGGLAIAVTPGGLLAVSGNGARILLYDGTNGTPAGVLDPGLGSAGALSGPFSSGSLAVAAVPVSGHLVATGPDGVLRAWDPDTGTVVWSADAPGLDAPLVYATADGTRLATCGAAVTDAPVTVWDAASGTVRWTQTSPGLGCVASLNPDGTRLAVSSWAQGEPAQLVLFDTEDGSELGRTEAGFAVGSLQWSPDGSQIFVGLEGGAITIRDGVSLAPQGTLTTRPALVTVMTLAPDGSRMAIGADDGSVVLWDFATGDVAMTLVGHTGPISSITFDPAGTTLFTASSDRTVRAWNVRPEGAGEVFAAETGGEIDGVDIAPDGSSFMVQALGGPLAPGGVIMWDTGTGAVRFEFDETSDFPFAGVAYSPDGTEIAVQRATVGIDDTGDTGNTFTEYGPVTLRSAVTGETLLEFEDSQGADRQTMSFGPDGSVLAVGATGDISAEASTESVYDTNSGALLHRLEHPAWATYGSFSPDGHLLATGTCIPGYMSIWDWAEERLLQRVDYGSCMTRVVFSPTDPLVIATGFEEPPTAWDSVTGEQLYTLEGHAGGVLSADFSSDGELIVTGGVDGSVRLWRAADGTELLTIAGPGATVGDARFFPDDTRILIGTFDGQVRVYTLDVEELVAIAESRITRTLTSAECETYHFENCG